MTALRLTPARAQVLSRLRTAGTDGQPLIDVDEPVLLREYGLIEFHTDPDRILTDRARLTALGERCVHTLIEPQGATA